MDEVSESPQGNKSIRYLNSHYADVASQNKERIAKWSVRGKGGGKPPRRKSGGRALSENWANAASWETLARIGWNFLSITELLFIAVIYYST